MTHLAVSNLLEMNYLPEDSYMDTDEAGGPLPDVLGGENMLVDILSDNGYRINMVESGWHMSVCGEKIDVCIPGPFIDDGVESVLSQSLFWTFFESSVGSAFTNGARHTMNWTSDSIGEITSNGIPDFVFVHVLAPHPPLVLDAECRVTPEGGRQGGGFSEITGVSPELEQARLDSYVEQIRCVNSFVRALAGQVAGTESLVFVTGDHGSDALSPLADLPEEWSDRRVLERMSTFLAVKAPEGCEESASLVTVVSFRSLVACAGRLDLPSIEEAAYVVSRAEVDGRHAPARVLDEGQLTRLGSCLRPEIRDLDCP